jgi:hypothetical protein
MAVITSSFVTVFLLFYMTWFLMVISVFKKSPVRVGLLIWLFLWFALAKG